MPQQEEIDILVRRGYRQGDKVREQIPDTCCMHNTSYIHMQACIRHTMGEGLKTVVRVLVRELASALADGVPTNCCPTVWSCAHFVVSEVMT